jgi:hypothetical protein
MRLLGIVIVVVAGLLLTTPAQAARVATGAEQAALKRLLDTAVGDTCDTALEARTSLPLIAAGGQWGIVTRYCQFTDPPSGAGTGVWTVWAHRSSPTAVDWVTTRPSEASRVPPCAGQDGLLTAVPEAVVRDLRQECVGPGDPIYRPAPVLTVRLFRNASHKFDSIGPSLDLTSLSEGSSKRSGMFSIARDGPPYDAGSDPRLKDLTKAFGTPTRTGCSARWKRYQVTAKACGGGRVTSITLGAPWQLESDSEDIVHSINANVRVGDPVALARALDPRLKALRANGRLRLPMPRIGTAQVTVHVLTRGGRISAITLNVRQRR